MKSRHNLISACVLVAATLTSGCLFKVGPDYEQPDVTEFEQFREPTPPGESIASDNGGNARGERNRLILRSGQIQHRLDLRCEFVPQHQEPTADKRELAARLGLPFVLL